MKIKWIGIVAGIVLVAGAVAVVLSRRDSTPDPIHNGKPASEWVRLCIEKPANTFATREPEFQPVQDIGSAAVPFLIRAIQGKNGFKATGFYNGLYKKMPSFIRQHLPAPKDNQLIRTRAYWTLSALGPVARPAVPTLAAQFNTNDNLVDFVRTVLTNLGPAAKEAIPTLTNAFHGPEDFLHWEAERTLVRVYPDYPELMPALLRDLNSTNVIARRFACVALGEMGPPAKAAVPALNESLKDPDGSVQQNAATALKEIGK